jgi:hypothetical protein
LLAIAWNAAINGVFRTNASHPPVPLLPLAIFLPVIIGAPLLLSSKRVGQVLDAMPATWLVALQRYRVFGSVFLAAGLRGVLPGVFALPAGIGDMLTDLFAVPARSPWQQVRLRDGGRRSSAIFSAPRTSLSRSP